MVEGSSDNFKNPNPAVKPFSNSIFNREIINPKKIKIIQLSFFDLDPKMWRRGVRFTSQIPSNWNIPPSESKAENLENARQIMLQNQKIADQENERRGQIRKQAINLIKENQICGLNLSRIRKYYRIHALDIVQKKPYECYLEYAARNNMEPMSFPRWADSTAQEIFVNDLIPKILWKNTPKNPDCQT